MIKTKPSQLGQDFFQTDSVCFALTSELDVLNTVVTSVLPTVAPLLVFFH